MATPGFFEKHGIVRNAVRKDLLYFALPALVVFTTGLVVSAEGWVGLPPTLWGIVRHPSTILALSAAHVVGLLFFVGGLSVAITAQVTLRRSYSSTLVIRKDHELVTHGIYRFSRHPVYLGVLIGCIGLPIYGSNLPGVLIMLILIPVFLNRIRLEERLLVGEFGDAYRAYRDATSKLVPFLY